MSGRRAEPLLLLVLLRCRKSKVWDLGWCVSPALKHISFEDSREKFKLWAHVFIIWFVFIRGKKVARVANPRLDTFSRKSSRNES